MTNKPIDPEYLSIDVPAEAYDAAEQLLSEMEGDKESDQDNQPLIMVEALNLYNQLKDMAVPLDAIIREMIKDFHITRK